jgi:hypothetical protein
MHTKIQTDKMTHRPVFFSKITERNWEEKRHNKISAKHAIHPQTDVNCKWISVACILLKYLPRIFH